LSDQMLNPLSDQINRSVSMSRQDKNDTLSTLTCVSYGNNGNRGLSREVNNEHRESKRTDR